jgi:3-hydroxyisobutyrate dehydrogenase
MIAFFGMGLLGSNFVRALRKRGEEVHVWNRNAEKARALESVGAKAFEDPAEAARGASRVHLTLTDDAAVDGVLERAHKGLSPNVTIVDHSTTSVDGVVARHRKWTQKDMTFAHAPVFMGPQNALESTGTMLISGDRALHDRLAPELSKMTGKLVYLGPQPERAAGFKLMGNLFLMTTITGVIDMLGLAKGLGIPGVEAVTLFDFFNPGSFAPARAKRILEADFAHPTWDLATARKDARLMQGEASAHGVTLAVLPAIAAEMQKWIDRGHGHDDWTVLAKDSIM